LTALRATLYTRAASIKNLEVGAMAVHAGARVATTMSESDIYFSADIETDGPIPGPFSMLSFALVAAGTFDGVEFVRAKSFDQSFYSELRPISDQFEIEALQVNGLDRDRLLVDGPDPKDVMTSAHRWIDEQAQGRRPVLVAYPLSFDWTWLYWYFVKFAEGGSPFEHSRCYDLKTAFAVKANLPICRAGRSKIPSHLRGSHPHTHHALDDAIEQAELFANIFEWGKSV
jgi:Exonuclease